MKIASLVIVGTVLAEKGVTDRNTLSIIQPPNTEENALIAGGLGRAPNLTLTHIMGGDLSDLFENSTGKKKKRKKEKRKEKEEKKKKEEENRVSSIVPGLTGTNGEALSVSSDNLFQTKTNAQLLSDPSGLEQSGPNIKPSSSVSGEQQLEQDSKRVDAQRDDSGENKTVVIERLSSSSSSDPSGLEQSGTNIEPSSSVPVGQVQSEQPDVVVSPQLSLAALLGKGPPGMVLKSKAAEELPPSQNQGDSIPTRQETAADDDQTEKEVQENSLPDFLKALLKNPLFEKSQKIVENGRNASALLTDDDRAALAEAVWNKDALSMPEEIRKQVSALLNEKKGTANVEITTDVIEEVASDVLRRIATKVRIKKEEELRAAKDAMVIELKRLNLRGEKAITDHLKVKSPSLVGSARQLSEQVQAAYNGVMTAVKNRVLINPDEQVDIPAMLQAKGFGTTSGQITTLADVQKRVTADISYVQGRVASEVKDPVPEGPTPDPIKKLFIREYSGRGYSSASLKETSRSDLFTLPSDSQPTSSKNRRPVFGSIIEEMEAKRKAKEQQENTVSTVVEEDTLEEEAQDEKNIESKTVPTVREEVRNPTEQQKRGDTRGEESQEKVVNVEPVEEPGQDTGVVSTYKQPNPPIVSHQSGGSQLGPEGATKMEGTPSGNGAPDRKALFEAIEKRSPRKKSGQEQHPQTNTDPRTNLLDDIPGSPTSVARLSPTVFSLKDALLRGKKSLKPLLGNSEVTPPKKESIGGFNFNVDLLRVPSNRNPNTAEENSDFYDPSAIAAKIFKLVEESPDEKIEEEVAKVPREHQESVRAEVLKKLEGSQWSRVSAILTAAVQERIASSVALNTKSEVKDAIKAEIASVLAEQLPKRDFPLMESVEQRAVEDIYNIIVRRDKERKISALKEEIYARAKKDFRISASEITTDVKSRFQKDRLGEKVAAREAANEIIERIGDEISGIKQQVLQDNGEMADESALKEALYVAYQASGFEKIPPDSEFQLMFDIRQHIQNVRLAAQKKQVANRLSRIPQEDPSADNSESFLEQILYGGRKLKKPGEVPSDEESLIQQDSATDKAPKSMVDTLKKAMDKRHKDLRGRGNEEDDDDEEEEDDSWL